MSVADEALYSSSRTATFTGLQKFLMPTISGPRDLYVHRASGGVMYEEGKLRADPFSHISFNCFFNSFYESYWIEYTPIRSIYVVLKGRGRLWCSVFRQFPDGETQLICRTFLDLFRQPEEVISFELQDSSAGKPGRLYIEIDNGGSSLTLDEISWETDYVSLREVSLGVVVCAYNRESLLVGLLAALLQTAPNASIDTIVVVNQGVSLSSAEFLDLQRKNPGRLRIIEQPNHGGSGGFTRGAMELLDEGLSSHILFLDDDVVLEPRHLPTAVSFLRYAYSPLIIGGQMLNLFDRTLMFDSGGRVEDNRVRVNHRNADMADVHSLAAFGNVAQSDFNGWWLSILPVECFRNYGLPLPLFLHVDDVEYGVRLTEAGITTVVLPPVSVWHEPFLAKPPGWSGYYDARNWLIFSSIYPARLTFESARALTRRLFGLFIRYDYQQILCVKLGLQDFLKGPRIMDRSAPEMHARIRNLLDSQAAEELSSPPNLPVGLSIVPDRPNTVRLRLIESLLRILLGCPKANEAGPECVLSPDMPLDFMHLGRCYVMTRDGSYFVRFRYSAAKTWRYLAPVLMTICHYAVKRRRAAALWKDAQNELSAVGKWWARFQNRESPQAHPAPKYLGSVNAPTGRHNHPQAPPRDSACGTCRS